MTERGIFTMWFLGPVWDVHLSLRAAVHQKQLFIFERSQGWPAQRWCLHIKLEMKPTGCHWDLGTCQQLAIPPSGLLERVLEGFSNLHGYWLRVGRVISSFFPLLFYDLQLWHVIRHCLCSIKLALRSLESTLKYLAQLA